LASQSKTKSTYIDRLNVSAARSAGLRASSGQIVAFCDDDAVPDANWLAEMMSPFGDPSVGAVGGKVVDGQSRTGKPAFNNGIVRLSGRQVDVRPSPGEFNDPAGPWYNRVIGCSCAFRREALSNVGGFDEFIEFAYDETDVCLRLIRNGWRIVHAPNAVVVHSHAPGGHRENALIRNWYCQIKNQLYVGLKNRRSPMTAARTTLRVLARIVSLWLRLAGARLTGQITSKQAGRYGRDTLRGFADGLSAGMRAKATRNTC